MNVKEFIRFTYGLFMGTSTPFLKPTHRYLFPTHRIDLDRGLGILLGGSAVCGVLSEGGETLLINCNQAGATDQLRGWVDEKSGATKLTVVLSSGESDFCGGLSQFSEAASVYVGRGGSVLLRAKFPKVSNRVEELTSERVLNIAGERVHLIPLGPAATASDLAIFLENRSVLFAGALYFNQIHPVLRPGPGMNPAAWIEKFETLLSRFQPKTIVPAEGDLGTLTDAKVFLSYLRDLTDPSVEFSTCRKRYDWPEIPSETSLEENFDLLREKIKHFTTLN